jgi:hypothetical protein
MACFELGPNLALVDSTRDALRFQRFDLRRIISLGRLPQARDEFASSTLNTCRPQGEDRIQARIIGLQQTQLPRDFAAGLCGNLEPPTLFVPWVLSSPSPGAARPPLPQGED